MFAYGGVWNGFPWGWLIPIAMMNADSISNGGMWVSTEYQKIASRTSAMQPPKR